MDETILFSILIPAYNAKRYIKECIESVITQTYKNWELLIIDDGSGDDTLEICETFSTQDSRIIVTHQENCGVSVTRNCLLNKAKGDYLIFLDSDDYWISDHLLQKTFEVISARNPEVVCWWTEVNNIQNGIVEKRDNNIRFVGKCVNGRQFLNKVLDDGNFNWWLWLYAIKKSLWVEPKISFNSKRKICEDEEVLFKIISRAKSIWNIGEYSYCYRIGNVDSAMGTISKSQFHDMIEVAESNVKYINESNCFDKALKAKLIRNFTSVYLKLGLRLQGVSSMERDAYFDMLKIHRWMLKASLGYMSWSFDVKVIIVIMFGNKIGFGILYWIERIVKKKNS